MKNQLNQINQFNKSKFFYSHSIMKKEYKYINSDDYIMTEKKVFKMTKSYINYLNEKKRKEIENELIVMKNKLDYQYKKYGEIDEIDFQEYQYKLAKYYEIYSPRN